MEVEKCRSRERVWRGNARLGYCIAHVASVRVPQLVCAENVAGACISGLGFDEVPVSRLVERAHAASERLADQADATMTRGKLARSSSAVQEGML
jgi:hypothetical protein